VPKSDKARGYGGSSSPSLLQWLFATCQLPCHRQPSSLDSADRTQDHLFDVAKVLMTFSFLSWRSSKWPVHVIHRFDIGTSNNPSMIRNRNKCSSCRSPERRIPRGRLLPCLPVIRGCVLGSHRFHRVVRSWCRLP